MWFFGFPFSIILGGLFYTSIDLKDIMLVAVLVHTLGFFVAAFSTGYTILLLVPILLRFRNGCTEAACNPMIAYLYEGNDVDKMLNRFHMCFPVGIVIGSLR